MKKTIDVLIGTYCIENDVALLYDEHDDQGLSEGGAGRRERSLRVPRT